MSILGSVYHRAELESRSNHCSNSDRSAYKDTEYNLFY